MSFRYPQPSNEDDFELFCLRLLRAMWRCPAIELYGKRGERQDGIDLIDAGGGEPLRAVQCKHHESDKTIPPKEIEAEVQKVLGSSLPIDEYYILTTAKKTSQGQNAVIRLNRENLARGRFKVFLWTWAQIEDRLSELDELSQDHVLRGDTSRGAPALGRVVSWAVAEHFDRPLYASATVLDSELEAVKAALDQHLLEVAEYRLTQIESKSADRLQPHHWYQLKVYRSRVHTDRGEWQKAGRVLLDAKRHLPDTERARINEALGHELVGNRERAHALATELRGEFPHVPRLLAIWLRTSPPGAPLAEYEVAAAPVVSDCGEVNLALAHLALVADNYATAERFARKATDLDRDAPHGWFILAQALHARGHKAPTRDREILLREALGHYDRAVQLAHDYKMSDFEAASRFNRGSVRWLLGDPRAEADYTSAADIGLPDRGHRTNYASFLVESGRFDDALRELSAVPGEPEGRRLLLEAAARHGRNSGDDRDRAEQLLVRVASMPSADAWDDAHVLLLKWATESKATDRAETVLATSALRDTHPLLFQTLSGWLTLSRGDVASAAACLRIARQELSPGADHTHLFLLAQVLVEAGDDANALPLFERCARPGVFNVECRKLLDCARRLNRHDVVVRVCRELREAGETDRRLVETEINVLQLYDPLAALATASGYLARHPDDRLVALWQSALALRLDRPELVVRDLARLPRPDEVTPHGSGLVLNILRETGQAEAGLRYAYAALREHFCDVFAHGQYVAYFLQWSAANEQILAAGTGGPGMAVCYREEHDQTDRWVIIEEASEPDPALGEIGPEHHLSRALTGRKVGEVVTLSAGGIQPRTATVQDAYHKFIYRFRDCMNQFQVRFPGESACQVIHVGSGDLFDPSPIIKGLEEQKKHVEALDNHYRKGPMTLGTLAELAGRDEFETWGHLTSDPSLGIRCCTGRADDIREVVEAVRACKTIVLEYSAIVTLAHLELLTLIGSPTWRFVVSQSTYDRLRNLIDHREDDIRDGGHVFLTATGKLGMVQTTAVDRRKYADFLAAVRDRIRDHCAVVPCLQAAGFDPQRRDEVTKAVGRHTLETMLLGASPETVMWTDDHLLSVVARTDFQTQGAWTQAVLYVAVQEGAITQYEFDRATAKMIGWHYHSILCNADTLVAAAEVANWDTTRWPVPQVMATLGEDRVSPLERLAAVVAAIRDVWRRDLSEHTRRGFLFAILRGMGSVRLVRRLLTIIPGIFSLDVISEYDVKRCIGYWLQNPTGLVRP